METNAEAARVIIAQIDGSMVPIVYYGELTQEDKKAGLKRHRECHWKEFRLCCTSLPDSSSKYYGVVVGTPFEAGCMMYQTCSHLGLNDATHIHGVADGATWIAEQYEEQFGMNHEFYLDFYHASEYLSAAAKNITAEDLEGQSTKQWLLSRNTRLLEGNATEVIEELKKLASDNQEDCPISKAYQYLANRLDYLNYPRAIEQNLPIGSGEVESGHRSVLQARLKQPGAWWKLTNAENMAHLKVLQANNHWEWFWDKKAS